MKFSNHKVLITGGSSGIGLELSKQLLNQNNKVIICGRSKERLLKAQAENPGLIIFQCDIAREDECKKLTSWIKQNHQDLNVIVNNAAIVHKTKFLEEDNLENVELEMQVNFVGPLRLIKYLYPVIVKNNAPQIVNITTGLVYTPRIEYPYYNSTKSALHAFTQVFRGQISAGKVKVTEVLFPVVDTPWHKGTPPKIAITPQKAVSEMIAGLEKGKEEIKVGAVKKLFILSRIAPKFAFSKINSLE